MGDREPLEPLRPSQGHQARRSCLVITLSHKTRITFPRRNLTVDAREAEIDKRGKIKNVAFGKSNCFG